MSSGGRAPIGLAGHPNRPTVAVRGWRQRARCQGEEGQLTILILGLTVIAATLILVGLAATTVQLARVRLFDLADAAALDAADTLTEAAYGSGVGVSVPLSDAEVRQAVNGYLAGVDKPENVVSWSLEPGTGSPDGDVAVVVLRGEVSIPYVSWVLDAVHGRVTVTVRSAARSDIVP